MLSRGWNECLVRRLGPWLLELVRVWPRSRDQILPWSALSSLVGRGWLDAVPLVARTAWNGINLKLCEGVEFTPSDSTSISAIFVKGSTVFENF